MKTPDEQVAPDPIEAWFATRMMYAADAVWPSVVVLISLLVLPATVALIVPETFGARTIAIYAVVMWVTWKPATDFEHADSHYHFFRRHHAHGIIAKGVFATFDFYLTYVFTLALARVPHWYEVQHVIIHHAEDNGPDDTQSTLLYDRASFIDFARCAHRFAVSGLLSGDVFAYLAKKNRWKAIRRLALGMLLFYGVITVFAVINLKFAIVILLARYAGGIISSMGFFQEHGIIDVTDPNNIYRNSLHYIAPDNTHGSRGEDFHIAHHLLPGQHWVEYESQVAADTDRYAEESAVGFLDGPGHIDAYYRALWHRDFVGLARYFILFGRPHMSTGDMARLLRARTVPLGAKEPLTARRFDLVLGRGASFLLG